MNVRTQAYSVNGEAQPLKWPLVISLGAHLLLLGLILYSPAWEPPLPYIPAVIDVQMVDLPESAAMPAKQAEKSIEKAPVAETPKPAETPQPVAKAAPKAKPEVSIAPKKKKAKTALKYKTFKNEKVLKRALKHLEKKVETSPAKPLEDTIKRLREKVAREGKPKPAGDATGNNAKTAKTGVYSPGSKQEVELIELYRLEIAYQIQKNWAFAEQLAGGGNLKASIVFKVKPHGQIVDIFFTDRSGNPYLDDSAHKAIVKSSPVKPHPKELDRPYVEMGLNFTPEGVR